jgi:hypothetical protein
MWGKILAGVGLSFFAYCLIRIIAHWQYRNAIEKTIWLVIIAVGGGWCLTVLIR